MNESLKVDISFTEEESDKVLSILKDVGATDVKQVKQRGLTGIEIAIVGTFVASALANLVIRLAPMWKCGVLLDARGSRILTEKNCDLPRGTVLIISPNGTQSKLHEPSQVQIESLIKSFGSGKS